MTYFMKRQTNRLSIGKRIMSALLIIHCPLFISTVGAQTFTQRLQTPVTGGGRIVIHQDAAIDALVNGPETPRRANNTSQGQRQGRDQQGNNNAATSQHGSQGQQAAAGSQQQATDSVAQNNSGRTRRIVGYRIQAFVGGKTRADRQRAEQTGNALRSLFPGQRVYVHFYSPRWICRMGNFRTYEEAKAMLDEVIRMGYDSATIVRGRITVTE